MDGPHPLDPATYEHLRALAGRIHAERSGPSATVRPTDLLHEAWLKVDRAQMQFESRTHFIRVAAKAMRQILVDQARAKGASKRGGADQRRTTLSGLSDSGQQVEVVALDAALTKLSEVDPVAAEVVVMRVFGGLTVPEVADSLGISARKVNYTWRFARAFLMPRLLEG